jgi:aminopeptidase YwaD
MLGDYEGNKMVEIAALNGEDYYSVPGQMDYIYKNQNKFNEIFLNINIDGAGYIEGKSTFSLFGLPEEMKEKVNEVLSEYDGIIEEIQYPQGDHSIFIQNGCPAIAVSSKWLIDHMESQTITHTPKDNVGIVDCRKVVEIAEALKWLILK